MLVAKKRSGLDTNVVTMKTSTGITNYATSKSAVKKLPIQSNLKLVPQQKPTPKKPHPLISSLQKLSTFDKEVITSPLEVTRTLSNNVTTDQARSTTVLNNILSLATTNNLIDLQASNCGSTS